MTIQIYLIQHPSNLGMEESDSITTHLNACEGTISQLLSKDDCWRRSSCSHIDEKSTFVMEDMHNYGTARLFIIHKGQQLSKGHIDFLV